MTFLCEGKGTRLQLLVLIRVVNSVLIASLKLSSQIVVLYDLGSLIVDTFRMECMCIEDNESYDKIVDKGYLYEEDEVETTASELWIVYDKRLQWKSCIYFRGWTCLVDF